VDGDFDSFGSFLTAIEVTFSPGGMPPMRDLLKKVGLDLVLY